MALLVFKTSRGAANPSRVSSILTHSRQDKAFAGAKAFCLYALSARKAKMSNEEEINLSGDICGVSSSGATGAACPQCGRPGLPVNRVTVAALVKDEHLPAHEDGFHLCTTPECPVAYFSTDGGTVVAEDELKVPIWFKRHTGPVPVCYCAGVTDREIMEHIERGCCSTLADIQKHTGANTGGRCLTENPTGR